MKGQPNLGVGGSKHVSFSVILGCHVIVVKGPLDLAYPLFLHNTVYYPFLCREFRTVIIVNSLFIDRLYRSPVFLDIST